MRLSVFSNALLVNFVVMAIAGCSSYSENQEIDSAGGGGAGGGMSKCALDDKQLCYTGSIDTVNIGVCRAGIQSCDANGNWGQCLGEVIPQGETCNGTDDNCDGIDDMDPTVACSQMEMQVEGCLAFALIDGTGNIVDGAHTPDLNECTYVSTLTRIFIDLSYRLVILDDDSEAKVRFFGPIQPKFFGGSALPPNITFNHAVMLNESANATDFTNFTMGLVPIPNGNTAIFKSSLNAKKFIWVAKF